MKIPAAIALALFVLALALNPAFAQARPAPQKIKSTQAYFLKSRGPKNNKLICFISQNTPRLGLNPKRVNSEISYYPFKPKAGEKRISRAAISECRKLVAAPACRDRCDNDGDGSIDFPKDPGCASSNDTDEAAASGACSDGVDNDGDGKTDYPEDEGCKSAGDNDESNQPEALSEFSVFRKPFAGEYRIASMFDHRYPQEFVHVDGSVVTHTNEITTIGVDGHQGYDYAMDEGTELLAAYDGTVVFAGAETPFFCPPLNKTVSGNAVIIRHQVQAEQFDSVYGHLSSIGVVNGQTVKKGDLIGLSGTTGCSTGPHLHFDIRRRTNTNGGSPSSIDPSGWMGPDADPWASHPSGTESFRLWAAGEAPAEYRLITLPPNPGPSNSAAVAITTVRWAGLLDDLDPNNEYVELTIDPRFYSLPTYPLGGATLRNNKNEKFTFPSGYLLHAGKPIRVYSGVGVNSADELYWGRTTGAWDNSGDCVHLIRPTGNTTYALYYGDVSCQTFGIAAASDTNAVHAVEFREMEPSR